MKSAAEQLTGVSAVHVADREGDSYELLAKMVQKRMRFIIRLRADRKARKPFSSDPEWSRLKTLLRATEGLLEREVPLSPRKAKAAPGANHGRPPRKARLAKLQFSAAPIEIKKTDYLLSQALPKTLTINVVRVLEIDVPPGETPVEWFIATTEPIATPDDVAKIVDIYRARWCIEEFNQTLKTGCAYETREFESKAALLNVLALSLPIAVELLWLRSRARADPEAPATDVLSPTQIRVLQATAPRKLPEEPTARQALLAIAEMGGHVRANGEPGWLVLHRGLAALFAYEAGWAAREREADL